jgi:hypothetical protein
MPEAERFVFDLKELTEILLKQQEISEGHWGIYVEFTLAAANVERPDTKELAPAAINFIGKLGVQKFPAPNALTIDAAKLRRSTKKAPMKAAAKGAVKVARKK